MTSRYQSNNTEYYKQLDDGPLNNYIKTLNTLSSKVWTYGELGSDSSWPTALNIGYGQTDTDKGK